MKITILTLFPEIMEGFLNSSIFKRARDKGIVTAECINFRQYSDDKHKKVDDYVFAGGAGLLIKPQPLFAALDDLKVKERGVRVVYPCANGRKFDQTYAKSLSTEEELVLIAGHYEGIDGRVVENYVTDPVCIGDYVISSGEVSSLVVIDAVFRLIPGVINPASLEFESFNDGLLEGEQYTQPREYCNFSVPFVLLNGNHRQIRQYNREMSIKKTYENRPDLLEKAINNSLLSKADLKILDKIREASKTPTEKK